MNGAGGSRGWGDEGWEKLRVSLLVIIEFHHSLNINPPAPICPTPHQKPRLIKLHLQAAGALRRIRHLLHAPPAPQQAPGHLAPMSAPSSDPSPPHQHGSAGILLLRERIGAGILIIGL